MSWWGHLLMAWLDFNLLIIAALVYVHAGDDISYYDDDDGDIIMLARV